MYGLLTDPFLSMSKSNNKQVTLKDLANHAGLSIAAVSRCLDTNPKSTARVSEATVKRVKKLAERLGYRHNRAARSLRKRRTDTIGMICFQGFLKSFPHRLVEATSAVKKRGFLPFVHHMHDDSQTTCREICQIMIDHRVDGVMLLSPTHVFSTEEVKWLLSCDIPLVAISNTTVRGIPQFAPDKETGFYLMAKHLIEEGYDPIYLLGNQEAKRAAPTSQASFALRGFRRAAKEAADSSKSRFGFVGTQTFAKAREISPVSDPTPVACYGYAAAKRLAEAKKLPDAFLCLNTGEASGVMRALAECGIRVPWDVAVAGFSTEPYSSLGPVPLTTVEHDFKGQCEAATAHLVRLIQGEIKVRHEIIYNSCHLLVSQSTVRRPMPPLLTEEEVKLWMPDDQLTPRFLEEIPLPGQPKLKPRGSRRKLGQRVPRR